MNHDIGLTNTQILQFPETAENSLPFSVAGAALVTPPAQNTPRSLILLPFGTTAPHEMMTNDSHLPQDSGGMLERFLTDSSFPNGIHPWRR